MNKIHIRQNQGHVGTARWTLWCSIYRARHLYKITQKYSPNLIVYFRSGIYMIYTFPTHLVWMYDIRSIYCKNTVYVHSDTKTLQNDFALYHWGFPHPIHLPEVVYWTQGRLRTSTKFHDLPKSSVWLGLSLDILSHLLRTYLEPQNIPKTSWGRIWMSRFVRGRLFIQHKPPGGPKAFSNLILLGRSFQRPPPWMGQWDGFHGTTNFQGLDSIPKLHSQPPFPPKMGRFFPKRKQMSSSEKTCHQCSGRCGFSWIGWKRQRVRICF